MRERELEEDWDWDEVDDAGAPVGAVSRRNRNAYSTVFSIRLGLDEFRELAELARAREVGTTVLARAMIRGQLAAARERRR